MLELKELIGTTHSYADSADAAGESGVLPAPVSIYQKRGFETGYRRGVSETLATVLEAGREFVRLRHGSSAEKQRLFDDFSEFLEEWVRRTPPDYEFVDGAGI